MEGESEMQAALQRFEAKEITKARKAVREGATIFADTLKENTPVSNRDKGKHLQSDINTGSVTGSTGELEAKVGYGTSEGWRAHFPNSGTHRNGGSWKQKPQHFIEKSQSQAKPKVLAKFAEEMRF